MFHQEGPNALLSAENDHEYMTSQVFRPYHLPCQAPIVPGTMHYNEHSNASLQEVGALISRLQKLEFDVKVHSCFFILNWVMLVITMMYMALALIGANFIWFSSSLYYNGKEVHLSTAVMVFLLIAVIITMLNGSANVVIFHLGIRAYKRRDAELFERLIPYYIGFFVLSIICCNVMLCVVFLYLFETARKLNDYCFELGMVRYQLTMYGISVQIVN